jgi:hypothetical protein
MVVVHARGEKGAVTVLIQHVHVRFVLQKRLDAGGVSVLGGDV